MSSPARNAFQTAVGLHRTGDAAAAAASYREALAADPDYADAAFNLAALLAGQGQYDQAITYYMRVLELAPDEADALSNLGNIYQMLGRTEEARALYMRAIAAHPGHGTAHVNLGNIHFHERQLEEAVASYRRAVEVDPFQADAYNNLGTALQHLGRPEEAAEAFDMALMQDPRNAEAHRNLGNILVFSDVARAEAHFRDAIRLAPQWPLAHADLGLALKRQDRHAEAEQTLRRAVELDPDALEAWQRLADICLTLERHDDCRAALDEADRIQPDSGMSQVYRGNYHAANARPLEAAACFARACELMPGQPDFLNSLGNALHGAGRHVEAEDAYRQALELRPDFPEGHNNLANALASQGRAREAIRHYRRSLELNPDQAMVATNLGNVLRNERLLEESVATFRLALEIDPGLLNAFNGLGLSLQMQNRHGEAIENFNAALAIKPDYCEALNNLAVSLVDMARYDEAVTAYKRVLEVNPELTEAMFNLGTLLQALSRWDQSTIVFKQALSQRPDYNVIHPYLAHSLMQQCSWTNLQGIVERIRENIERELADGGNISVSAFALQSLPGDFSMRLRQRVAETISDRAAGYVEELATELKVNYPRRRRHPKLRIGYLSPDFRFHSVAVALKGIIDHHDHDRFEIYGYSLHSGHDDDMTRQLVERLDGFEKVSRMPFRETVQMIRDTGIDILVDLAGHTRGAQPSLLALRPAPIQAHYLGYSATTGARFLDYLITDHQQVPEEQREFFTEQLVYLPDTFMATQRAPVAVATPDRAACGLPEEGFVFCNFNANYKLEPRMWGIWMRLLRKVPGSVLWLMRGTPASIVNLRKEAQARGVDPARIVFAERVPHPVHLARLRHADLAIDNLYHGGGVTTVDCLWMGLPVLTITGPTPQSRNGASLLAAIGQQEMITARMEDYEALAIGLAHDPARLARLRAELTARRDEFALFRPERLTRHLERGYELMWENFAAGRPPAMIDVPRIED